MTAMEYRRMGRSGLAVSALCLGCWTFGREVAEPDAQRIIRRFVEAGGTFLDTADGYALGLSEEITGRAIRGLRDQVVLATKVFFPMGPGLNERGLSRAHIMRACDASLKRLGTDYIDLYQPHCWDMTTPLEETLGALSDMVHQGKVRYIGVSNFTAWQIMKCVHLSETKGFERIVTLQPQYSLIDRTIEYEVLPACREEGVGLIPWSPLGGGFLSGKYRPNEPPPPGSRIAEATEGLEDTWERRAVDRNWRILDAVGRVAAESGRSYAQVALNWLLRQSGIVAPIIGARTVEQLEDNLGAVGWELSPEHVSQLSAASAPDEIFLYRFIPHVQRPLA
ncbi:MAG TPA: aldo/keto reductase [Chloroflexota bacterium]|nr:aldo/keto reductase [Chloroflexota bacterium]